MRALKIVGKLEMRIDDVPIPRPVDGEVRIHVFYAGICGSDLHYYFEGANGAFVVKEPLVPGHELSGQVDLDPSGTYPQGTPVTVHPARFGNSQPGIETRPHLWPGGSYLGSASTWPHTQGGMVEYLNVGRDMIRPLPIGMPLSHAALAEPLAVGLHAANIAGNIKGAKVLISGSGPIGLLCAAGAMIREAGEIVCSDVLDGPLQRARALGATKVIQVGKDEIPENYFDYVFECSGFAPAVSGAIRAVRPAGTVVQVGMLSSGIQPIIFAPVVVKEVTIKGAFRFDDEIDEAIALLATNTWIGDVVTNIFALDEAEKAFEVAKDSQNSGKVLIRVSREGE